MNQATKTWIILLISILSWVGLMTYFYDKSYTETQRELSSTEPNTKLIVKGMDILKKRSEELEKREKLLKIKEMELMKNKLAQLETVKEKEEEEEKEEKEEEEEEEEEIQKRKEKETKKETEKKVARSLNVGYTLKSHEGDLEMLIPFFQSFLVSVPAYTFKEFYFVTNEPISNTLASTLPPFVKLYNEELPPLIKEISGYNHQQWTSLVADRYMNSTYVGILDADQIIHTTITSRKIFTEDGKLILMKRNCFKNGVYVCPDHWNKGAHYLMGLNLDYNYMINLPFYFPLEILPRFRAHVEKHTGLPFNEAFHKIGKGRSNICQVCFLGAYLEKFEPWRIHAIEVPFPAISEHVGWTVILKYKVTHKKGSVYNQVSHLSLSRGYCNQFNIKKGYKPDYCKDFTVPLNQPELYTFTWEGKKYFYDRNVTDLKDYFMEEDEFTIPVRPNDHDIIYQVQEV